MVSEKYPLNANAQIFLFHALLTGMCLKVTAGPFLNIHRVRILTYLRGTLGEMKTKHGVVRTSVSCGGAGLLMFDSEFGNTGQCSQETVLDQQAHPFGGDTAVSSEHDRWWLSEASVSTGARMVSGLHPSMWPLSGVDVLLPGHHTANSEACKALLCI